MQEGREGGGGGWKIKCRKIHFLDVAVANTFSVELYLFSRTLPVIMEGGEETMEEITQRYAEYNVTINKCEATDIYTVNGCFGGTPSENKLKLHTFEKYLYRHGACDHRDDATRMLREGKEDQELIYLAGENVEKSQVVTIKSDGSFNLSRFRTLSKISKVMFRLHFVFIQIQKMWARRERKTRMMKMTRRTRL